MSLLWCFGGFPVVRQLKSCVGGEFGQNWSDFEVGKEEKPRMYGTAIVHVLLRHNKNHMSLRENKSP